MVIELGSNYAFDYLGNEGKVGHWSIIMQELSIKLWFLSG